MAQDPVCGACHPPALRDLDPTTSIYLCPKHEADYSDHVARLRLTQLLQPRKPYTDTTFKAHDGIETRPA